MAKQKEESLIDNIFEYTKLAYLSDMRLRGNLPQVAEAIEQMDAVFYPLPNGGTQRSI